MYSSCKVMGEMGPVLQALLAVIGQQVSLARYLIAGHGRGQVALRHTTNFLGVLIFRALSIIMGPY